MRRISFLLAALVVPAACHGAPPEPTASDAATTLLPNVTVASASASASASAAPSASVAAEGPAADAGDADGGRAAERAFCRDAFGADQARMKEKCAVADFSLTQTVARTAGSETLASAVLEGPVFRKRKKIATNIATQAAGNGI